MSYNGWTNYETWDVALWIDNEQGSYGHRRRLAQQAWEDASEPSANFRFTGSEPFTREERAVLKLSESLKDWIEEDAPDLGASIYSDLLTAALSEVNWHEIAQNFMEEVDKTEEDEEAETEEV